MDIACETVFLTELQKNKAIILTKENTRSARDKKRVAWMGIQQVLVATSGKEYSVQQLCKKWNNLQQRVKEKIRNNGTDKMTKTLHERDLLCLQIIGPENLNLPTGPLDLNLSEFKPDIVFEEPDEQCPVVVTLPGSSDHQLIDVMINNNHQASPKQSTESQVLDLVMNNQELKNNLVTSLASLQNLTSSSSRNDISLQDIDNIQTNIFTELANRISQINGTRDLAVLTGEQISSHLAGSDHQITSQLEIPHQDHMRFINSPGSNLSEYNGLDEHRATHNNPCIKNNKRKRRSSTTSTKSSDNDHDSRHELLTLKREVLQLKKEKLLLANEKMRLEIEQLKKQRASGEETQTLLSNLREVGTQTPEPRPLELNVG